MNTKNIISHLAIFIAGGLLSWFLFDEAQHEQNQNIVENNVTQNQHTSQNNNQVKKLVTTEKQPINQTEAKKQNQPSNSNFSKSNVIAKLAQITDVGIGELAMLSLFPSVEKVDNIIEELSEIEIRETLTSLTGFDRVDLEKIKNGKHFAKNLVRRMLVKEYSDVSNNQIVATRVNFSDNVNPENIALKPANEFIRNNQQIYASFVMPEQYTGSNSILIKWYLTQPYKIMLFNKYEINAAKEVNFVWLKPNDNWKIGNYRVEVLAIEDKINLLAQGTYNIVEQ